MSQRLRVVGWLRFGSKRQLEKGLTRFADSEAPDYFEGADWDVEGLDARIDIDTELPGDFEDVERPFIAMFTAAKYGYVDYFEEENPSIRGGVEAPIKRWARAFATKFVSPDGTLALNWPEDESAIVLDGSMEFETEKVAASIIAQLPFRLPFLAKDGARELRLGGEALKREGNTVAIAARVIGPVNALGEPIAEALTAIAAKAKNGAFGISVAKTRFELGVGGKRSMQSLRKQKLAEHLPKLSPVDSKAPLPVSAARADEPKHASDSLHGQERVMGAIRLASGRIAVWGGPSLTICTPQLSPIQSFRLKESNDDILVSGVHEFGASRFAVTRTGRRDVDILDLETRTREVLPTPHVGLRAATVIDGRLVTIGFGDVAVYDGLKLERHIKAGNSSFTILVLPDSTLIATSSDGASKWSLTTGQKLEDVGAQSAVHVLADGSWLLENYGKFGAFSANEGHVHEVVELDQRTLAIFSDKRRTLYLVDRATSKTRAIDTGHTRPLHGVGGIVRVGAHWMTYAKSLPDYNESHGFDGTLKRWTPDWTLAGEFDAKSPIRKAVPLGGEFVALLFDGASRSKEIDIVEGMKRRTTIKAKKPIVGALAADGGRFIYWSKDGVARIAST